MKPQTKPAQDPPRWPLSAPWPSRGSLALALSRVLDLPLSENWQGTEIIITAAVVMIIMINYPCCLHRHYQRCNFIASGDVSFGYRASGSKLQ